MRLGVNSRSWWPQLALLATTLANVAGCEPIASGASPELPTWAHRPNHAIEVLYQRDLLARSKHIGEPYERGQPTIDPAHRRVFVGSSDGGLYCLGSEDGNVLWRFQTAGAVQSEPLYDAASNTVYFGSNDGALYKVRAADGQMLWRFSTQAEVNRRPILAGGLLYAVNANDTVIAIEPETGVRRWSQHRLPAYGMEIAGHAGLLVRDGRVHVAFSDGTVTAYDARDGNERWQPVDLSAESEQELGVTPTYLDVDTTPVPIEVADTSAVVVGSYEGGVTALDAETGNQLWRNPTVLGVTDVTLWSQPSYQKPAEGGLPARLYPARKLLIVSTGTTGLWGLDPETGVARWHRDLPDGGTSRPVVVGGALMITTTRQGLFLVSPLDGGVIDGLHTEVGFSMPAAAYGLKAFVLTNTGKLLALSVVHPGRR